ncbi:MAG: preprotein translocase subunit SecE [Clostridiales bacterium]|jgi:preprotein translocase subunit SecE|nr:preprotein translocase subunit SecE [Clostridiales bacterium]
MAEKEKKQNRIVKFFRDLKSERKKVTWPTLPETNKRTWVVIVELVAVAVLVGVLDYGFSKFILWLAKVI